MDSDAAPSGWIAHNLVGTRLIEAAARATQPASAAAARALPANGISECAVSRDVPHRHTRPLPIFGGGLPRESLVAERAGVRERSSLHERLAAVAPHDFCERQWECPPDVSLNRDA